jgi:hypothetical protein
VHHVVPENKQGQGQPKTKLQVVVTRAQIRTHPLGHTEKKRTVISRNALFLVYRVDGVNGVSVRLECVQEQEQHLLPQRMVDLVDQWLKLLIVLVQRFQPMGVVDQALETLVVRMINVVPHLERVVQLRQSVQQAEWLVTHIKATKHHLQAHLIL